jgi:hypothetical protein
MISRSAGRRLRAAGVEADEALRTLRLAAAACLRDGIGISRGRHSLTGSPGDSGKGFGWAPALNRISGKFRKGFAYVQRSFKAGQGRCRRASATSQRSLAFSGFAQQCVDIVRYAGDDGGWADRRGGGENSPFTGRPIR